MLRINALCPAIAGLSAVLGLAVTARAVPVFGIGADNQPTVLFSFDSATPGTIVSGTPVTGLGVGENLVGIDFRPATGQLYGVGSSSRIYTINTTSGLATAVSSTQFTPLLNGVNFDIDFNPTVDRIRVVSDADQNLRLNPDTGAVVAVDGTLSYAVGDPNAGKNPNVAGAAYTNNVGTIGGTTTLYAIDSSTDTLDIQNANLGTLTTVGSLGVNVTALLGFDIYTVGGNNFAVAQMQAIGTSESLFYTINLATGAATAVDQLGGGFVVRDIAVAVPEPASLGLAGIAAAGLLAYRRRA